MLTLGLLNKKQQPIVIYNNNFLIANVYVDRKNLQKKKKMDQNCIMSSTMCKNYFTFKNFFYYVPLNYSLEFGW